MSDETTPGLAHLVFFTLKESTSSSREALVEGCRKYLTDHPGLIHFSAGARGEAYQRPVNDTEFDVAVVLVFASESDHDRYQTSERHQQFLSEFLGDCAQVRVFDALVSLGRNPSRYGRTRIRYNGDSS